MQRTPLLIPPSSCFHCELFNNTCDICNKHDGHCMKYHAHMPSHLAPCTWRSLDDKKSIQQAIDLANEQLAGYYDKRHNAKQRGVRLRSSSKKRGHVRGLTRRLTISPDFFKPS